MSLHSLAITGKQLFTCILSLAFFFTNCVFAHAPQSSFWVERKRQVEEFKKLSSDNRLLANLPRGLLPTDTTQVVSDLPPFESQKLKQFVPGLANQFKRELYGDRLAALARSLPYQYGNIRDIAVANAPKQPKTVIYIQDVHLNSEAQSNISKTIQELTKQNKIGLVTLEGASGHIDLGRFMSFPYQDTISKVADYLLRENKISGAITAAFNFSKNSSKNIPVFVGIDHSEHHRANIEAYKRSITKLDEYKKRLTYFKNHLNREKSKTFNSKLMSLDSHVESYHQGKISLGQYTGYLSQLLNNTPHNSSPEIHSFLRAFEIEKTLDFSQVELERNRILEEIAEKLDRRRMSDLLDRSVAYRLGKISHTDFYSYLRKLCLDSGIEFDRYKAMAVYLKYILLAETIKAEKVFSEIKNLEKAAYTNLAKTSKEKELVARSKYLYLVGKLLDFSLTTEEWQEYKEFSDKTDMVMAAAEASSLRTFENFYQEANIRDAAMTENLIKVMNRHKVSVAVLVAGGFHYQGISSLLAKSGVTTISFVPKITKVDSEKGSAYLGVFAQEKTPLEKLFAGQKLFVAQNPFSEPIQDMTKALFVAHREAVDPLTDVSSEDENAMVHKLGGNFQIEAKDVYEGHAEFTVIRPNGAVTSRMSVDRDGNILKVHKQTIKGSIFHRIFAIFLNGLRSLVTVWARFISLVIKIKQILAWKYSVPRIITGHADLSGLIGGESEENYIDHENRIKFLIDKLTSDLKKIDKSKLRDFFETYQTEMDVDRIEEKPEEIKNIIETDPDSSIPTFQGILDEIQRSSARAGARKTIPSGLETYLDPDKGSVILGLQELLKELKQLIDIRDKWPEELKKAQKLLIEVSAGMKYIKDNLRDPYSGRYGRGGRGAVRSPGRVRSGGIDEGSSDEEPSLPEMLVRADEAIQTAREAIKRDFKETLNHIRKALEAFRDYSNQETPENMTRFEGLLNFDSGEIPEALREAEDAIDALLPKKPVDLVKPEVRVATGKLEWVPVDGLPGSGVVAVDERNKRILGPTAGATRKFHFNLSNISVDQEKYWPSEVVTLKIIRPELRNTVVNISVEGPGSREKIGPVLLNEHGLAAVTISDGSRELLRVGQYKVKVFVATGERLVGETTFEVTEGSLGEVSFARKPEHILIGRDPDNPQGNRWAMDPSKPNGLVLKEFWIAVNGKPYNGFVTLVVECEYCGEGVNALVAERELTLRVEEGRITPPDDLPDSDVALKQIGRTGRSGSSIMGAWTDPDTGQRAYELNTSYHTGAFVAKVTVPGHTGTARYRVPGSHHEERQTVEITEGLGRVYQFTVAPWTGLTQVPGRNVYVGEVKQKFSANDPVHILNRKNERGQEIPGIIADEDGYINLEVKKVVTGLRIYGAIPQSDGSFKDRELVGIGSEYGAGEQIKIPVQGVYSYIKVAGFDKETDKLFTGHTPVFTPAGTKVDIETPRTGAPGSKQTVTIKTTDRKGNPKSVGVLVLVSDTRVEAIDPSEKLISETGKSIRNAAGALYQQRDTTGTHRFISYLAGAGGRPSHRPSGAIRTRGAVRTRGGSVSRPQEPTLPQPPAEKPPMEVIKEEEEEAEEMLFMDAYDAGMFVGVPTRRIVATVASQTNDDGVLVISDMELGGQPGARYQVQVITVDADNLDYTTLKEKHISATQSLSVDVSLPELIMEDAELKAIATVRIAKKDGPYSLEIHGAGLAAPFIHPGLDKGTHRIPFDLKGGVEGELVLELKGPDGAVKKHRKIAIRKPFSLSIPLSRLEMASDREKTVYLDEGETLTVYPNVGQLLHGMVRSIITITKGWYPHLGSQSAKVAIKAQLLAAIEHGVMNDEGERVNLIRMVDSDVQDLYTRFYDEKNGQFSLHPGIVPDLIWSARVVRELVHARRFLDSSPTLKEELSEALELINKMINGVETAVKVAGEDIKDMAGYDPSTGDDVIIIKDEKGKRVKTILADPKLDELLKKALEEAGISGPTTPGEDIAEVELKAIYERIGDLEDQIQAAKAAFLAGDMETFLKIFHPISQRMALGRETGMIRGASLLGGIHSSAAAGLAYIELLVMMAEKEKMDAGSGKSIAREVRFRGKTYPLTRTLHFPEDADDSRPVDKTETAKIPPFSVAQVDRSWEVQFEDFKDGPEIATVVARGPAKIRQNEQTSVTITLKEGRSEEYYVDVLLPTTVSLDRVRPSYMDPYGKMLFGLKTGGSEQIHAFTLPFGNSRTMELVLDGSIVGKSKGLVLVRHIDNPTLAKTLELPEIEVTPVPTVTGHADLSRILSKKSLKFLQKIHKAIVLWVLEMKESRHIWMAKKLGKPVLYASIDQTSGIGKVDIEVNSSGEALLFWLADPLGDLFMTAFLLLPSILGISFADGLVQYLAYATVQLLTLPFVYIFAYAGTRSSRNDWANIWELLNASFPDEAEPQKISGHGNLSGLMNLDPQEAAELIKEYEDLKRALMESIYSGNRDGYIVYRHKLIDTLKFLKPYVSNEKVMKQAVKISGESLSVKGKTMMASLDEILMAVGESWITGIEERLLSLAREAISWLPAAHMKDPSHKEYLAQKLKAITHPFNLDGLIPKEPIVFGAQGLKSLGTIFQSLAQARPAKMMAITQTWGTDTRVAVSGMVKEGEAMFEASILHEYLHALGIFGVLPITPKNEVLTHAVTATRMVQKEGLEGVKKTERELAAAFELGTSLYDKNKLPDPKENPQAFIRTLFVEVAKVMDASSPEWLERLSGSAVSGWFWKYHQTEADSDARAQYVYHDIVYLIYRAEPSITLGSLTPADLVRLENRRRQVEDYIHMVIGDRQWRVKPYDESAWMTDEVNRNILAPVRTLLHPDEKVTFGAVFDFIARQNYVNDRPIEESLRNNFSFRMLYGILALPRARAEMIEDTHYDVVPGWIQDHIKYQFADPVEMGQAILAKMPRHLQFLEAIYYQVNFDNQLDQRITDTRVKEALEKVQSAVSDAMREENPQAYYELVKNKIWPVLEELIKEDMQDQAEQAGMDQELVQKIADMLSEMGGMSEVPDSSPISDMLPPEAKSGAGMSGKAGGKTDIEPETGEPSEEKPAGTPGKLDNKPGIGKPALKGEQAEGEAPITGEPEIGGEKKGEPAGAQPEPPGEPGEPQVAQPEAGKPDGDTQPGTKPEAGKPETGELKPGKPEGEDAVPGENEAVEPKEEPGEPEPYVPGEVNLDLLPFVQEAIDQAIQAETDLDPEEATWYDTRIYGPMESQIDVLKERLDDAFPPTTKRRWQGRQPQGPLMDPKALPEFLKTVKDKSPKKADSEAPQLQIMQTPTGERTKPEVYIYLMVDETGSMRSKLIHTQRADALFLESLVGREQIRVEVSGYSSRRVSHITNDDGFPIHLSMKAGNEITKKDIVNVITQIAQYTHGNNFRDLDALLRTIDRMRQNPTDSHRHIFVITDGDPDREFDRAKYKRAVLEAEKEGIFVWGLWMDMYGELLVKELFPTDRAVGGPSKELGSVIGDALLRVRDMYEAGLMTGRIFSWLYKRFPKLTSLVLAPLIENSFVVYPAYLILTHSGFLIPFLLATGWILSSSIVLAYNQHKTIILKQTGQTVPASPEIKRKIFFRFAGMGALLLVAAFIYHSTFFTPALAHFSAYSAYFNSLPQLLDINQFSGWAKAAFGTGFVWHVVENITGNVLMMANGGVPEVEEGESIDSRLYIEKGVDDHPGYLVVDGERYPVSINGTKDHENRVPVETFYTTDYNVTMAGELLFHLFHSNKPIMTRGLQGTGKDFLIRSLLNLLNRNARLIPFHEDMTEDEIFYQMGYSEKEDEMIRVPSDFLQAAINGEVAVLGEYNKLRDETRRAFLTALDTMVRTRKIHVKGLGVVNVHPDFRVIGSLNQGAGFEVGKVDAAESERWVWLDFGYLPRLEEIRYLRSLVARGQFRGKGRYADKPELLDEINGVIESMVDAAIQLREKYKNMRGQSVPRPLSTRVLVRIVQHLNAYPEDVYMMGTILNRNFNMEFEQDHIKNLVLQIFSTRSKLVDRPAEAKSPEFSIYDLYYEGEGENRFLVLGNARVRVGPGTPASVKEILDRDEIVLSSKDLRRFWWIMKDISLGVHMAFVGFKGTGKSVTADLLGELINGPAYEKISFTESTLPYEYIAQRVYKKGKLVYEELALPRGMRGNKVTVLEEFNSAPPKSRAVMNEVFARNELSIPERAPIRAHPGDGFVMIATMNPPKFYKREKTSSELWDRMTVEVFDYPEPLDELAKARAILPDKKYEKILEEQISFANVMRTLFKAGKVSDAPSMRFVMQWAKHFKARPQDIDSVTTKISRYFSLDEAKIGDIAQRDLAGHQTGLHKHFMAREEEKTVIKKAVYGIPDDVLDKFMGFFDLIRQDYKAVEFDALRFPIHPNHELLRDLLLELRSQNLLNGKYNMDQLFRAVNNFFYTRYINAGLRHVWLPETREVMKNRRRIVEEIPGQKEKIEEYFNKVFRPELASMTITPTAYEAEEEEELVSVAEVAGPVDVTAATEEPTVDVTVEPPAKVTKFDPVALGKLSTKRDIELGSKVTALVRHPINSDHVIVGMENGHVEIWNIATNERLYYFIQEYLEARVKVKENLPVKAIAVSHSGDLVAVATGKYVLVVEYYGTEMVNIRYYLRVDDEVEYLAFDPSSDVLAIGLGKDPEGGHPGTDKVMLFDVKARKRIGELTGGHPSKVTSLAWSPDGKFLITGHQNGGIALWNIPERKAVSKRWKVITGGAAVTSLVWVWPDGKVMFLANNKQSQVILQRVRVETVKDTGAVANMEFDDFGKGRIPITGEVTDLAFSEDGKLLYISTKRNSVEVYEVEGRGDRRERSGIIKGDEDYFTTVVASVDGKTLIAGSMTKEDSETHESKGALRIWDLTPAMKETSGRGGIAGGAVRGEIGLLKKLIGHEATVFIETLVILLGLSFGLPYVRDPVLWAYGIMPLTFAVFHVIFAEKGTHGEQIKGIPFRIFLGLVMAALHQIFSFTGPVVQFTTMWLWHRFGHNEGVVDLMRRFGISKEMVVGQVGHSVADDLPEDIRARIDQLKDLTSHSDIIGVADLIFELTFQEIQEPGQELYIVRQVISALGDHGYISQALHDQLQIEIKKIIKKHDYGVWEDGLLWTGIVNVLDVIHTRYPDSVYAIDRKPAEEVLDQYQFNVPHVGFYGSFAPDRVLDTVFTFDEAVRQSEADGRFLPLWILDKSWLELKAGKGTYAKTAMVQKDGQYVIIDFKTPIRLNYMVHYNERFANRLEKTGIPLAGHPRVLDYTEDKTVAYSILEDHRIPFPKSLAFLRKDKVDSKFAKYLNKPWITVMDVFADPDTTENPYPDWKADMHRKVKEFNEGGDFVVKRNRGLQADTVSIIPADRLSHNKAATIASEIISDQGKTGLERSDSVIVQERIHAAGLRRKESHLRVWVSRDESGRPRASDLVVALSEKGVPTNLGREALSWEQFIAIYPGFSSEDAKQAKTLAEKVMSAFDQELAKDPVVSRSINSKPDFLGIDIMIREGPDKRKEFVVIEVNDFHAGWMEPLEKIAPDHQGLHSRDWVKTMVRRAWLDMRGGSGPDDGPDAGPGDDAPDVTKDAKKVAKSLSEILGTIKSMDINSLDGRLSFVKEVAQRITDKESRKTLKKAIRQNKLLNKLSKEQVNRLVYDFVFGRKELDSRLLISGMTNREKHSGMTDGKVNARPRVKSVQQMIRGEAKGNNPLTLLIVKDIEGIAELISTIHEKRHKNENGQGMGKIVIAPATKELADNIRMMGTRYDNVFVLEETGMAFKGKGHAKLVLKTLETVLADSALLKGFSSLKVVMSQEFVVDSDGLSSDSIFRQAVFVFVNKLLNEAASITLEDIKNINQVSKFISKQA